MPKISKLIVCLLFTCCFDNNEDATNKYTFHNLSGKYFKYSVSGIDSIDIKNISEFKSLVDSFQVPEKDTVISRNNIYSGVFYDSVPFLCNAGVRDSINCAIVKTGIIPDTIEFHFIKSGDSLIGDFDNLKMINSLIRLVYINYHQNMNEEADSISASGRFDSVYFFD